MELKKYKLGECLELLRGYDLTSSQMQGGEVAVVGSNGIIGYHNSQRGNSPCITVGRSGSVGKVHYYEQQTWAHNTALFVKDFKGNNPKYLYYLLKNLHLDNIFEKGSSVIPSLDRKLVHSLVVPFHKEINDQRKIVAVLSAIDHKIELNKQINDNLEAMAKQLYDYWFVQFDFPNEDGKPYKSSGGAMVWNDKLKREIPQGWSISNVKSLIEPIERGISYSSDDLLDPFATPMINLACFSKAGDYRLGEMKFFSGKVSNDKLISPIDMLIACTDMTQGADIIGRPILASDEYDQYTFSTDLALITPKGKFKMYLYYTLRTPFYHKYIRPFASGTTVKHLNLIGVENYGLPVPPIEIQSKFEDLITPIKEKQSKNLNEINALTKQRDELLPLLMNGQATVNYHLSAKVYPLPTAYKKAMPIVANQIKVPWKTCVVPRISYDSSYYCCLDCNYFLSNYLTIAAFSR